MSTKESRSNFKSNAVRVKPQNYKGTPMRGGIRL